MRRMIMRTVPALLVFLLLFGFTACGRKLQNDTDIGNTAAVSSEDRPDKGKLSGGKGQADQQQCKSQSKAFFHCLFSPFSLYSAIGSQIIPL